MAREARTLELKPEIWAYLDQIQAALDHDEPEETLRILIEMGVKAISITDMHNRTIKMFAGERRKVGEQCRHCGNQRELYTREVSVQIGVAAPSKEARDESEDQD